MSGKKPSPRQLDKRCLCGSGKAFKNCHGQEYLVPKATRVPRYAEGQKDTFITPPGYTYNTFVGLDAEGQPISDPEGGLGEYEADFTLLQPGQAAEKIVKSGMVRVWQVQNERIVGDSHLALTIPKDARPSSNAEIGSVVTVPVERPDGSADDVEMFLRPNAEGRLSKVSLTLRAESFSDAWGRAHFEASSFLSHVSFELDIPLRIAHTLVKETSTGHVRIGFVRQFGYKGLGNLYMQETSTPHLSGMPIKPEPYPALSSVYREALNSESPFYQFLCFCRIVQRLTKNLRPGWRKVVADHEGGFFPSYEKRERFPKEGEEAERFPEAVWGKKFTSVYDHQLTPLRDGIAHVFLEDGKDQRSADRSTDEYGFTDEVYAYLPAAHHMARTMLENDFGNVGFATQASRLNADVVSTSSESTTAPKSDPPA